MERYQSIVAINVSVFLMMLGVGLIVAILPQKILSLSGSISKVGYLASCFAISYIVFQIPMGSLADRFGFKPFLVGGYFVCTLAGILFYYSKTTHLIFLGRILQGMGEVPVWALAPALLSCQYPDHKGKMIGIYNASLHCGLTAGSLLGIFFSQVWQGHEAFLLYAGVSFTGGLFILIFVDNPYRKSNEIVPGVDLMRLLSIIRPYKNQSVLFGIVLYGAGYGIFITIIPAFLIRVKGSSPTMIGVFFALFYMALSLSQLIAGPFSDCKGRNSVMLFGLVMAFLGIASFSFLEQPLLYVSLTMAAIGLGIFCVSAMAYLNERVPNSLKGTIQGAYYFAWGIGYFSGPLLLGSMCQSHQWGTGFLILAGLFLMALFLCAVVEKDESYGE